MIGLGTVINTALIIAGGLFGILVRKGIKENYNTILMQACGVAVIFIGLSGAVEKMLLLDDSVSSGNERTLLLVFSLVIGGLAGEFLSIERRMDGIGEKIRKLARAEGDSRFIDGFVNATLVVAIGAMAIVGSIQDGISGDYIMLLTKGILDFFIVLVFASVYGIGAAFSAIPVFVYQMSITLIAAFSGQFISDEAVANLAMVGSVLVFCVGINITFGKKIKVGNLLPAVLVPLVYSGLKTLAFMI